MRVYFVSAGYDACYYVRCLLPLVRGGWNGDMTDTKMVKKTPQEMAKAVSGADIVVFQRPLMPDRLTVASILKDKGKKIVFDNDDTYIKDSGVPLVMNNINSEYSSEEILEKIDDNLKTFASISDLVTVSTDFLAKEYRHINTNIVTLPNCVEPLDWPKPLKNNGNKVRIGLVGSVAYSRDFSVIKNILKKLSKDDRIQLVTFSLPANQPQFKDIRNSYYKKEIRFWNSINTEWHSFVSPSEYINKLNSLRLDLMLIPRENNYFNRCKSNVKFLEAGMLEIPVIAQSFSDGLSPYQQDSDALVLTDTQVEWESLIDLMVSNHEYRKKIGVDSRKYIIEKYSIEKNIDKWKNAYKSIL